MIIPFISNYFMIKVSCLTVSTDDEINITNNDSSFGEIKKYFEEAFDIKIQVGYVIEYINLCIDQYPLGFNIYQTDHIMNLFNKWFLYGKFLILIHQIDLVAAVPLTETALNHSESKYIRKFLHTLVRLQHIAIMTIIYICFTSCSIITQTDVPTAVRIS